MNSTLAFGFELPGDAWGRKEDQIGSAFEIGGISSKHQQYLALGGLGFILGDGHLNYGHETVSESYYNVHLLSGLYMGVQLSFINNPGYNRDRGPVVVPGVRAHVDF
jgi:high affinity Mn2+ porin